MTTPNQQELDFGAARQERIQRALRAASKVNRAVPLSDADKLMLACMESLATQVAQEVASLPAQFALLHTASRISAFVANLDGVAPEFAIETARFLHQSVEQSLRRGLAGPNFQTPDPE